MTLNISNFGSLRKFLVCYFNEDFLLEYGNQEDALADFKRLESKDEISKVVADLERLFSSDPKNSEVKALLLSAHCAYDPCADGHTEIDWLHHVWVMLKDGTR